jgi:hypothetical protein
MGNHFCAHVHSEEEKASGLLSRVPYARKPKTLTAVSEKWSRLFPKFFFERKKGRVQREVSQLSPPSFFRLRIPTVRRIFADGPIPVRRPHSAKPFLEKEPPMGFKNHKHCSSFLSPVTHASRQPLRGSIIATSLILYNIISIICSRFGLRFLHR